MNKKELEINRKEGKSPNRKNDRFYVGDVIQNKITNKVLEVYNIMCALDDKDHILFYDLCNVGEPERNPKNPIYEGTRSIPGTAFNHWTKI